MTMIQDRSITIGSYVFDEKKHIHKLDGKPLHGVTTVLKVIGKGDVLVQWSANMACDFILANGMKEAVAKDPVTKEIAYTGNYLISEEKIEEARKAWTKVRDKAGGFGTNVHNAIECWIKKKPIPDLALDERKAYDNFTTWAINGNITFLGCERNVYSREMWVGGILDLIYQKDGKVYLGDIKTAKGIYPEAFFQMGAYDECLQEMGEYPDIEGYTVINLKKTGEINVETNYGREQNREAFKCALKLFKILESTKKTI